MKLNLPRYLQSLTERMISPLVGDALGQHVRLVPPSVQLAELDLDITEDRNTRRINGFTPPGGFVHIRLYNHGPDPLRLLIDPPAQTAVADLEPNGVPFPSRSYEFGMFGSPPLARWTVRPGAAFEQAVLGQTLYLYKDDETKAVAADVLLLGYGAADTYAETAAFFGAR